jgi:anion-transporting  ArsA/GET3 family ATPase
MTDLGELRFVFITGKGGVGKTTVTAALAVALAGRGRRVLIAATDAKERVSSLFGRASLGSEIVQLADRIFGVRITPEVALREYGEMILRSKTVYDAVFDNKYVRSFFAGVPGLYEWAVLGKAWFHSTERLKDGTSRFDIVLLDAPATGHGVDMLRVPKIIVDVVPPGILRRDAERAWKMFQDPAQSGVCVVTLPEDMPTNETLELIDTLTGELKLPLARLVINAVLEPLFSDAERAELLRPRDLQRARPGDEAIACGIRRSIRERVQAESLARLEKVSAPTTRLPLLLSDPVDPEAIRALSRYF